MSEAFNEDTSDLNISAPYDLPGRYKEIIKNLVRNYIEMWLPEDKTYPNLKTLSESVCNEIINKLFRISDDFYKSNICNNVGESFAMRIKKEKKQLRAYAIRHLGKLLDEGQEYILKQTKENDESKILMTDENEYDDNQWQVNRMTDTAKRIWSTWKQCVREMPRAGIIPVSISDEKVQIIVHYRDNIPHFGYAKGKLNRYETLLDCAIREYIEECGVSAFTCLVPDGDVIERKLTKYNRIHYYYIIKIHSIEDVQTCPLKGEIMECRWISIYNLPCNDQHCIYSYTSGDYSMIRCLDIEGNDLTRVILKRMVEKSNYYLDKYDEIHRNCRNRQNFVI